MTAPDMDVLRQTRYFLKLQSHLLRHPEIKQLLCRLRLLNHHIHSKKTAYDEAKRAVSLLDRIKVFSNSDSRTELKLAKAAMRKAEERLSIVHQELHRRISRLVSEQLHRNPDFYPIILKQKLLSVMNLKKQWFGNNKKDPGQHNFSGEAQRSPSEMILAANDVKQMIERRHGPTPLESELVSALYHMFLSPNKLTSPNHCTTTPLTI
ncbi:MAG: hypothetical protein ACTSVM_06685 [Candidatus Ranarchaeia archaeon]